jgi:polyketide biosynthesis enoyl-CoA hydratase PksH
MNFKTIAIEMAKGILTVTLNRPDHDNRINLSMLRELHAALNQAEVESSCRLIVLQGQQGIFCTGLDFHEVQQTFPGQDNPLIREWTSLYMALLKRFTTLPKTLIARVEGKVIAGGMGLVAASDFVLASEKASFKLSEALWGLLPAMVAPYLIRRIGFQKAYTLTLSCQTLSAPEAFRIDLVDQLTDELDKAIQEIGRRMGRIEEQTLRVLKEHFRRLSSITDAVEKNAEETTSHLLHSPLVQNNIAHFLEKQQLPWGTPS